MSSHTALVATEVERMLDWEAGAKAAVEPRTAARTAADFIFHSIVYAAGGKKKSMEQRTERMEARDQAAREGNVRPL
jgi:hypothetical protein